MRHLFLCGFMGSGKTTVGHLLAEKLRLEFFDSDLALEEKNGLTVSEMFEQNGEPEFRRREVEIIFDLSAKKFPAVISLGGGSLMNAETSDRIRSSGKLVYLKTSVEELSRRLQKDSARPLLRASGIQTLYEKREPGYSAADLVVTTDKKTPAQVASEIAAWWNQK